MCGWDLVRMERGWSRRDCHLKVSRDPHPLLSCIVNNKLPVCELETCEMRWVDRVERKLSVDMEGWMILLLLPLQEFV